MVCMRGGGWIKSKPLSLSTVDVSVYPSCHAESCHVTVPSFCCERGCPFGTGLLLHTRTMCSFFLHLRIPQS